jgi:hypothetical protein
MKPASVSPRLFLLDALRLNSSPPRFSFHGFIARQCPLRWPVSSDSAVVLNDFFSLIALRCVALHGVVSMFHHSTTSIALAGIFRFGGCSGCFIAFLLALRCMVGLGYGIARAWRGCSRFSFTHESTITNLIPPIPTAHRGFRLLGFFVQ